MTTIELPLALQLAWFLSAVLFITGLRRMSSPRHARSGVHWAAGGMVLAVLSMFGHPSVDNNAELIVVAMLLGGVAIWPFATRLPLTGMPRAVALFTGLGGGAAAAIATLALLHAARHTHFVTSMAVIAGLIGCVSLAGSMMAFGRLGDTNHAPARRTTRQVSYLATGSLAVLLGLVLATSSTAHPILLVVFLLLALGFGVLMTLPIKRADLPVLVSFYNAATGAAVAIDGYVMGHGGMMVAGTIVMAAGAVLTRLMARSVNRRLSEIMYSGFGIDAIELDAEVPGDQVNLIDAVDAAVDLAYAERVLIVPGYGMATSQAQHKLRELTQLLDERGVETRFAIHPVAGRMPGHMDVLLSEAGVPYEKIVDLAGLTASDAPLDVVLTVGANDITNPAGREDRDSTLFGMPVFEFEGARRTIMLKRGDGPGYAGIQNPLLFARHTRVLHGDARASLQDLIDTIKGLD